MANQCMRGCKVCVYLMGVTEVQKRRPRRSLANVCVSHFCNIYLANEDEDKMCVLSVR